MKVGDKVTITRNLYQLTEDATASGDFLVEGEDIQIAVEKGTPATIIEKSGIYYLVETEDIPIHFQVAESLLQKM